MTSPGTGPAAGDPWAPPPVAGGPPGHPQPYGYADPPPDPGSALAPGAWGHPPGGYGYPPGGYGYPPAGYGSAPGAYPPVGGGGAPPGVVVIPGGPVLRAASPGQRTLARLIDSAGYLVVFGGAAVLGVVLTLHALDGVDDLDHSYGYVTPRGGGFPVGILWIYALPALAGLLIVAYESLTIGLTGSTLGGRLTGVRFVRTSDGSRPGFGRALGRAAALGASTVVCDGIVFLLLLLSMFFDQQPGRYQSWLDKLCGLQAVTTRE